MLRAGIHLHRQGAALGMPQRRLEALRQALAHVLAYLEPVDHDVDAVLLRLRQLGQGVDVMHLAIHPQAHEALGLEFGKQVELFALAVGHHRGEDHQLGFLRQGQHVVHHLRDTLRLQRQIVVRAVRRAGAGVEQAQVVVDLGDGADGRARVVAGGLLLDRDGGAQPFDQVHIRLFHELQKLPRVGRKRFDVTPLALGVQGVKGE